MATQTQYPIRNIRNADELYGKKICKFKWEGGSFYAPMIQTTQLQRTAVVIEHSTVTDMPIAQYGLCKSPTVTLTLYLTDAVPYKTSQLTYNVNDVTARRVVDDLNTIYEKHLPFSITIPQAFTDYLHDLVMTSLVFQASADKRFVIQADIAATSVNVVKLGYQQGVVITESQAKANNEGNMYISDLSEDDKTHTALPDIVKSIDYGTGPFKETTRKYRSELYNLVKESDLLNDYGITEIIQRGLGISNTEALSQEYMVNNLAIMSTIPDDSVTKITAQQVIEGLTGSGDNHTTQFHQEFNLLSYSGTESGGLYSNENYKATIDTDATNCGVTTIVDYGLSYEEQVAGTEGAYIKYAQKNDLPKPQSSYGLMADSEGYLNMIKSQNNPNLKDCETITQVYQEVQKRPELWMTIEEAKDDNDFKLEYKNGSDEDAIKFIHEHGKFPVADKNADRKDIQLLGLNLMACEQKAKIVDKNGNVLCEVSKSLLTPDSAPVDCGELEIMISKKDSDGNDISYPMKITDAKVMLVENQITGETEVVIQSEQMRYAKDQASGRIKDNA